MIERAGLGSRLSFRDDGVLGVRSVAVRRERQGGNHLIAYLELSDAGPDRLDDTGKVPTGNKGQLQWQQLLHVALAHGPIYRIDRCGMDLD